MSQLQRSNLALTVLFLAACGFTQGATFTYNTTVTLDAANLGTYQGATSYEQAFSGTPVFNLQAGDVLTGTISFAPGQSMTIQNPSNTFPYWVYFQFFSTSASTPSTQYSQSVQVLGLTGALNTTNPTPFSTAYSGSLVAGINPNGAAANFSFTGFNYTINVLSVTAPNSSTQISSPFSLGRADIVASQIALGNSTPEPATFALCGLGCVALGLFRPRKESRS